MAVSARAAQQGNVPLRSDAMQRVLAFGALIVSFIVFCLTSSTFTQFNNVVGSVIATAVNGILALGITFVIISGGIDRVKGFTGEINKRSRTGWHRLQGRPGRCQGDQGRAIAQDHRRRLHVIRQDQRVDLLDVQPLLYN